MIGWILLVSIVIIPIGMFFWVLDYHNQHPRQRRYPKRRRYPRSGGRR